MVVELEDRRNGTAFSEDEVALKVLADLLGKEALEAEFKKNMDVAKEEAAKVLAGHIMWLDTWADEEARARTFSECADEETLRNRAQAFIEEQPEAAQKAFKVNDLLKNPQFQCGCYEHNRQRGMINVRQAADKYKRLRTRVIDGNFTADVDIAK